MDQQHYQGIITWSPLSAASVLAPQSLVNQLATELGTELATELATELVTELVYPTTTIMCKNTPYFAAYNIELPLLLIITIGMLIRPDHQERWENSEHYHTRCMCILEVAMYGLSVQVCPNCLNHWLLCYLFISF